MRRRFSFLPLLAVSLLVGACGNSIESSAPVPFDSATKEPTVGTALTDGPVNFNSPDEALKVCPSFNEAISQLPALPGNYATEAEKNAALFSYRVQGALILKSGSLSEKDNVRVREMDTYLQGARSITYDSARLMEAVNGTVQLTPEELDPNLHVNTVNLRAGHKLLMSFMMDVKTTCGSLTPAK